MRGTALLLAMILAGCAASNPATSPNAPAQAADWRYADGSPVSEAEFAGLRQACEQQARAETRPRIQTPATLDTNHEEGILGIPPSPNLGVPVPGISGTSVPSAAVPPQPALVVDRCLEAKGLMPAH
jgi:hypothetical protein